MKVLAVLALVAVVALARHHRSTHESEWFGDIERTHQQKLFHDNHKYTYLYNGQLATGIPGTSSQHSATRIQAVVEVVLAGGRRASLKIQKIRMGKLNSELPRPQQVLPFQFFEQEEIIPEIKEILHMPVHFMYQNGLVRDVQFEQEEKPWSENIKKGMLSMLQINMHKQRQIIQGAELDEQMRKPIRPNDYFVATETTVEGDCATFYTVTDTPRFPRQEERVLNITKTIDFEQCDRQGAQQRPDIRYNFRFSDNCPTCQGRYDGKEKMLDSSSVYKYSVKGNSEKWGIERVTVESQYTFIPITEQSNVIVTYVNQTMELVRSEQKNGVEPISQPTPKTSLVYSTEWDEQLEEHYLNIKSEEFFRQSGFPKLAGSKVKLVRHILTALEHDVKKQDEGQTRQFARLVEVLRMCSMPDLKHLFKNFYEDVKHFTPESQRKVKQLFVDALSIAGTRQTLTLILEKMSEIGPMRGAWALKSFVNARVVDARMIEQLIEFSKTLKGKEAPAKKTLRQAALLTAGTMMNKVCRDDTHITHDKIALQFRTNRPTLCDKETFVSELERLWQQAKSEEDIYEQVLVLKTIGNAAIDTTVVKILEPIIKGEERRPIVIRSQAVEALRLLRTSTMRRKIQQLLMPIYMNQKELPEMRMIAVYEIMQTLPEQPILEQIAKQVYVEKSRHVASFVLTHLVTIANSTNPCEKRVADDLKLALRHAKAMPYSRLSRWSMLIHKTMYSQTYRSGLDIELGSIKGRDSYMPKKAGITVNTNLMSSWQKSVFGLGFEHVNMDELLGELMRSDSLLSETDSYLDMFDTDNVSPRHQPMKKNPLKKLYQKLQISERQYYREQNVDPIAFFYMKYKDQNYGILPITPTFLNKFYKNGRFDVSALRNFETSFEQNMGAFVSEFSRKIPTSMGLPIRVTMKMPTVVSVKGTVKVNANNKKIQISMREPQTIVSTIVTEIETYTPVVSNGLKVVAQGLVHLPLHMQIKLDARKQELIVQVDQKNFKEQNERVRLLTVQTYPTTFTRVWPKRIEEHWPEPRERTIRSQEWNRVNKFEKTLGEETFGLKFHVRGHWQRTPSMRLAGTPICPLSGPNKIDITVRPAENPASKMIIKLNLKLSEEDKFEQPEILKQFFAGEDKEFFESREESNEFEPEEDKSEETFTTYQNSYEPENPRQNSELRVVFEDDAKPMRRSVMLLRKKCDEERLRCTYVLIAERTHPKNREYKVEVSTDVLFPQPPFKLEQLADRKMISTIVARWGTPESMSQRVSIKLEGERSREQERLDSQRPFHRMYKNEKLRELQPELFSPVSQYDELMKAAVLTQFKFDIDYNINDEYLYVKNYTSKVLEYVKYHFYPNTYINPVPKPSQRGEPNRIRGIVTFDPRSLRQLNLTAQMPHEVIRMVDIPMTLPLPLPNTRRSAHFYSNDGRPQKSSWLSFRSEPAQCKVQSSRVESFDESVYRVPLTTCYTVLAKDCRDNGNFAVLMKKISQESPKKTLRVVSKYHDIVLTKKEGEFELLDNGKVKQLNEYRKKMVQDHVVLRLLEKSESESKYVKISLPESGVTVYFDGYTATIKLRSEHQNFQCGICGHFDQERTNEYRLPNNEYTEDITEFNRRYIVDEQCSRPEELLNDESNYELEEYAWEQETDLLDRDFEKAEITTPYSRKTMRPRRMTQVKEVSSRICFSTEPVPVCPKHTYPKEYSQENVQIQYRCISRSSPQAEVLHEKALRYGNISNDIKELSRSQIDDEIDVVVPEMCKVYNYRY